MRDVDIDEAGWSLPDELRSVVEKCENIEQASEQTFSVIPVFLKKFEEFFDPPLPRQILRRGGGSDPPSSNSFVVGGGSRRGGYS